MGQSTSRHSRRRCEPGAGPTRGQGLAHQSPVSSCSRGRSSRCSKRSRSRSLRKGLQSTASVSGGRSAAKLLSVNMPMRVLTCRDQPRPPSPSAPPTLGGLTAGEAAAGAQEVASRQEVAAAVGGGRHGDVLQHRVNGDDGGAARLDGRQGERGGHAVANQGGDAVMDVDCRRSGASSVGQRTGWISMGFVRRRPAGGRAC